MNILYEAAEVLASFIEVFLLFKVYGIVLRKDKRRSVRNQDLVVSLIGAGIIQICNCMVLFSYFTMLIFVLYTSVCAFTIYKTNYIVLFSISSFYMLCIGCVDFLVFTLVSNFFGGYDTFIHMVSIPSPFRIIVIFSIKCFWILLYFSLRKFLFKLSLDKKNIYTFLLLALAGFLGFIYLVDRTFKSFNLSMTGIWVLFIAFFSLILFMVYFIFKFKEENMKLSFAEMRNNLLEENYNAINEIYMSNAKLYHDLNNHLNVLYQLLEQENTEEAKTYIKEISKPMMQLSKAIWTGVDVVDVVINSKVAKMKEKGIPVHINVEFPKNTNIRPHDMCTILSNLLDNAIEASEKLKNPEPISFVIRRIKHFVMIKISNATEEKQSDFVGFPNTSKENKELHGWGIPSVKDTVEKYNGSIRCVNEDGRFVVTVMLFYEVGQYDE